MPRPIWPAPMTAARWMGAIAAIWTGRLWALIARKSAEQRSWRVTPLQSPCAARNGYARSRSCGALTDGSRDELAGHRPEIGQ